MGADRAVKSRTTADPFSLPSAGAVHVENPRFGRAGSVFVGTAFSLCTLALLHPPPPSSSLPRQSPGSADTEGLAWLGC